MRTNLVFLGITLLIFTSVIAPDPVDPIFTSLEGYSWEDLKAIALAADDFQRAKLPSPILILRGLREFIDNLSSTDIKNIIVSQINSSNGELSVDKLIPLAGLGESSKYNQYKAYLKTLTKDKLISLATAGERYTRSRNGQEDLIGGLHDYIFTFSEDQIINIILNFISKYPELGDNDLLGVLANGEVQKYSEIKTFLEQKDHAALVHLAIACESYQRKKTGVHLIGGLHDYANSLSDEQLVNTIINFVHNNPELSVVGKLDSLVQAAETLLNTPMFGGIEDYIRNYNWAELKQLALAADQYDLDQRGIKRMGGLHDYVNRLTSEDLISVIMNVVRVYPVLRKKGELEKLTDGSGKVQVYGYAYALKDTKDDKLKEYCLAVEKYDQNQTGQQLIGGLHDYIDRLGRKNLFDYLDKMSKTYPLIYQAGGLDKIVEEAKKQLTFLSQ